VSNSKTNLDVFGLGVELNHLNCPFKEEEKGKGIKFIKMGSSTSIPSENDENKNVRESHWSIELDSTTAPKSKPVPIKVKSSKNESGKTSVLERGVQVELFNNKRVNSVERVDKEGLSKENTERIVTSSHDYNKCSSGRMGSNSSLHNSFYVQNFYPYTQTNYQPFIWPSQGSLKQSERIISTLF
jgi:hypothetical protein